MLVQLDELLIELNQARFLSRKNQALFLFTRLRLETSTIPHELTPVVDKLDELSLCGGALDLEVRLTHRIHSSHNTFSIEENR